MVVTITTDRSITEDFKVPPKKCIRAQGGLVMMVVAMVCFSFGSERLQLHRLALSNTETEFAKTPTTSRDRRYSNDTFATSEADNIISSKATGNATKASAIADNFNDNGNATDNTTNNAPVDTNRNKTHHTIRNDENNTSNTSNSSSEGGSQEYPTNATSEENHSSGDDSEAVAPPILTLLVMLSGEFGNNMFKIIRGWGVARLAKEEFGLTTRVVFAQQSDILGNVLYKADMTARHLRECFVSPSFRTEDFKLGNKLLKEGYFHKLVIPGLEFTLSDDNSTIGHIKENLQIISDYLGDHPEIVAKENNTKRNESKVPRLMVQSSSMIIYPIVNEFYDAIRENFVFDDEKCCGETLNNPPGVDESVLHYRNFATEMPESTRNYMGFRNLDVSRLSSEVLGHLKEGDKIAIAGRNLESDSQKNGTEAQGLISALKAKNLTVRFAPGPDAMADFCFLKQTRKELIGTSKSTYLQLAAYMGGPSMELARMYQYVTPNIQSQLGSSFNRFRNTVGSNWTHPELRARIRLEEYF